MCDKRGTVKRAATSTYFSRRPCTALISHCDKEHSLSHWKLEMLICNIPGSAATCTTQYTGSPTLADPTILQFACVGALGSDIRRSSIELLYSHCMASLQDQLVSIGVNLCLFLCSVFSLWTRGLSHTASCKKHILKAHTQAQAVVPATSFPAWTPIPETGCGSSLLTHRKTYPNFDVVTQYQRLPRRTVCPTNVKNVMSYRLYQQKWYRKKILEQSSQHQSLMQ